MSLLLLLHSPPGAGTSTLAVDASTPALVDASSGTVTTASFAPPALSVLFAYASLSFNGNDLTTSGPAITDSRGLVWVRAADGGANPYQPGDEAVVWWAIVPSAGALTVSLSSTADGNASAKALRVVVMTGCDVNTPVGQSGSGQVQPGVLPISYTASRNGSWGWVAYTDDTSFAGSTPTPASGTTLDSSWQGPIQAAVLRQTAVAPSAGAPVSIRTTAPSTGTLITWAWVEILPAWPASPPPGPGTGRWPGLTIELGLGMQPGAASTWPVLGGDNTTFQRSVGDWKGAACAPSVAPGTAPAPYRNSLGATVTTAGTAQLFIFGTQGGILPGVSYTIAGAVRGSAARACSLQATWYNGGTQIGSFSAAGTLPTASWATLSASGYAPAAATMMAISLFVTGAQPGDQFFLAGPGGDTTVSRWINITRYVRSAQIARARRTYELDRFEAGTGSLTLRNLAGRFDPSNGRGPYAGGLRSWTPVRARAAWQGATFQRWAGFVERWPQTWEDPAFGIATVTTVDALAAIARKGLRSTYEQEVLLDSPASFYPCTEAQTSSGVGDVIARGVAPFVAGKYGTAGTAPGSTSIVYDGGSDVTFNPNTGANLADILDLSAAPGMVPQTYTGWSAEIWAENNTGTPGVFSPLFCQMNGLNFFAGFQIIISRTTLGTVSLLADATPVYDSPVGGWSAGPNHFVITLDTAGNVVFYVNGSVVYTGAPSVALGTIAYCSVGGNWTGVQGPNNIYRGLAGKIAFYSYPLAASRVSGHYNVGRFGGSVESTGNRAGRLLNYAGWPGNLRSIQLGLSTAGSAGGTGLSGLAGTDALSANQTNADAEGGQFYPAADNTLVFESRTYRASQTAPRHLFDPAGGLPYDLDSLHFDDDDTYLYNDIELTRDGGPTQVAADTTSQNNYFPSSLKNTLTLANDSDVTGRTQFLLSRYKDPHPRLAAFSVTPSENPALFSAVLDIDISDWEQVAHRPIGAPAILYDSYVDAITDDITVENGSQRWRVTYLLSPAIIQYWQLAASWTTVAVNAPAGSTGLALNPLPDAAVNPAASSWYVGDPVNGTAYQVQRAGAYLGQVFITAVQAVSPGYTSFLIGMQTSGFDILAGDVISSVLPPGITDPSRWDGRSILGSTTILAD